MRDPKPVHRLDELVRFALFTGRGLDIGKRFRNLNGKIGEYTIDDERLKDLKSEDIAARRPDTYPDVDLKNGKKRRGRYSKALGKT